VELLKTIHTYISLIQYCICCNDIWERQKIIMCHNLAPLFVFNLTTKILIKVYWISTLQFYLVSGVKLHVILQSLLHYLKHHMLHKTPKIDTLWKRRYTTSYSQVPPWCDLFFFFFFVFGRPRRYASGHVLFYDCARNERDAREKIENEWVGDRALGYRKREIGRRL